MSNNRRDAEESAIQKVLEGLSSDHSKRAYERNLREFFEWFRAGGETAVTKPVVQRYAEDLKGAGISPATINQKLSAIRSLALHAANAGTLQSDVADGVKAVRGVPRSVKDSSGHGNHGTIINPDHYRMGLAPIFGEGASGHLDGESYLEFGTVRTFGGEFHKGFYLGLDIQSEADRDLALCGSGVIGKTSLRVFLKSSGNKSYTLQVEVRDDSGRSLSAFTELSASPAKRLLISVFPPKSEVSFSEITLHEDRVNLQPTYVDRQDPSQFSALARPFIIGGFNADGSKHGEFVGRLAHIFLNQGHPMSADHLRNLVAASREDLNRFNGVRPNIAKSNERRNVFRDDLLKLRGWHNHRHLSDSEMKDASVVLYKWLCDRHPLLQDLCDELGIQLSFPGESDRGRAYNEVITKDKPVYAQPIRIGTQSIFGFKWVSLKQFLSDMAFVTDGHPVSNDAFVKFVRHKLGGAHFDGVDRAKWQRELAELPVLVMDSKAINFHMKQLVRSVLEAVEGCRIESQLRLT